MSFGSFIFCSLGKSWFWFWWSCCELGCVWLQWFWMGKERRKKVISLFLSCDWDRKRKMCCHYSWTSSCFSIMNNLSPNFFIFTNNSINNLPPKFLHPSYLIKNTNHSLPPKFYLYWHRTISYLSYKELNFISHLSPTKIPLTMHNLNGWLKS